MYGLEATMPQYGMKSFTKALACLARYGDELSIVASPADLSLSVTNSSKSAYARIKFYSGFFDKYSVTLQDSHLVATKTDPAAAEAGGGAATATAAATADESAVAVRGEILVKSVLSILRHRNIQETVNKCDLLILEGSPDAEEDSPESVFILRLHCKHGVVKTHKLSLNEPDSVLAPRLPSSSPASQSKVVVGPRTVKDLLEHFSGLGKMDAQLNWEFGNVSVKVKSRESGTGVKDSRIDTEISVDADEFDVYSIPAPPISIAFHLREFNATIALAESLSLPLNILFTRSGEPLSVEIQADEEDALFIIATSQSPFTTSSDDGGKRKRANNKNNLDANNTDTDSNSDARRNKKPARVVHVQRLETHNMTTTTKAKTRGSVQAETSPLVLIRPEDPSSPDHRPLVPRPTSFSGPNAQYQQEQPLFLEPSQPAPMPRSTLPPPLSQLSAADAAVIRDTGLGIEDMDCDEFAALMEDEGEEVIAPHRSTLLRTLMRRAILRKREIWTSLKHNCPQTLSHMV
ncbi:hypothetical protein BS47DRAFT_1384310 [Hydnum rufescens UP504]|uniref:Cell cycle checkpoint control protein n=1 Tax=Hydnum rufescens UP504 TaxID=1448309 RepID=A0A9P6DP45_9AGAM|nr:hypothetical protein BS47DRAFT_1384310 [Hydnum rufescens UP504]